MQSRKHLNIVMLTTVRFHHSKGGTEKVMIDTANALTELGHQVTILFSDKNGNEPGFPLNKKIQIYNCYNEKTPFYLRGIIREILSFNINKNIRNQKLAYLKLKNLASKFKKQIQNINANVYITYEPKLSAMLNKEFNITGNVITTFHFNPYDIANRKDTKFIEKYISTAGPIQVLREEYIESTRQLFPSSKEIVAIPNAIPLHNQTSTRKNKKIINIGRIVPEKNQILLAKAFGEICSQYPEWQVEIWGEANTKNSTATEITKIIKHYNMQNNFKLCGTTNNIIEKLQDCSIFAFPSLQEGFGLSLVEAMSVGLPSIGLESCSSVNTLIKNNINGILCKNEVSSFIKALKSLMDDIELREHLGNNALQKAQSFSPKKIWGKWDQLLHKISM